MGDLLPKPSSDSETAEATGPILVTGMPRSGTTWLARLLAAAPGTALAGREPMNPRGRQYGLARTLSSWVELEALSRRQRQALRTAYRGWNPFVYSRYGRRQWAAPLPWTRLVIKDPFAMLSLPLVIRETGATAVLLYRHPAAALASYRRMGWSPDLAELQPILAAHRQRQACPTSPVGSADSDAAAMGFFWAALYEIALDNMRPAGGVLVVSHEELAGHGAAGARRLFAALGLTWSEAAMAELMMESGAPPQSTSALHNLNRSPREVASAWRRHVSADEVRIVEEATEAVRQRLADARLPLP
jgi:hypothetical protein